MEYTLDDYQKDRSTADFVFKRYFSNFTWLKDELVQCAVIKLWKFKESGNAFRTKAAGANKIAKDSMTDYIRKESNHLGESSLLDEVGEDLTLGEIIPTTEETADIKLSRFLKLKRQTDFKISRLKGRAKRIIEMYLNRRSYQEIADCVGIAKQNVGECVKAFRKTMARELGLDIENI
jgi:DNA-directed RNA polymerase specialized sigma24 family protein